MLFVNRELNLCTLKLFIVWYWVIYSHNFILLGAIFLSQRRKKKWYNSSFHGKIEDKNSKLWSLFKFRWVYTRYPFSTINCKMTFKNLMLFFCSQDYNDDIRQEQMLEMQILSSQTEQRRLTPPESSRSGSEETLPLRDNANKQRVSASLMLLVTYNINGFILSRNYGTVWFLEQAKNSPVIESTQMASVIIYWCRSHISPENYLSPSNQ